MQGVVPRQWYEDLSQATAVANATSTAAWDFDMLSRADKQPYLFPIAEQVAALLNAPDPRPGLFDFGVGISTVGETIPAIP